MTATRTDLAQRLLNMIREHESGAFLAWCEARRRVGVLVNSNESTVDAIDAAREATNVAYARLCEARKCLNAALAEVGTNVVGVENAAQGRN
ncbi:MAG TPA: hypothetical protein VFJ25_09180 [Casimicrobiaceae bacterium]|nr:hypothetical protein [Casimicrobiaceae bacterium]